ncbi:MAG: TonB family protein [Bacteroidia bacterium]
MNFLIAIQNKKYAAKLCRVLSLFIVCVFLSAPLSAQTKKKGKVTTEYANGKKESSGKVKNYKKQGVWKYWSETGVLVKTITWKDDAKQGICTAYYADGKKSEEGFYSGNLKTGTWNSWYSDGKLSAKLNYTTDFLSKTGDVYNGVQQWWYENGQLREQSDYEDGKLVYKNTFYSNGKKRAIENYNDGEKNGTWRTYPEPAEATDSLPSSVDNYVNGKKDGVHLGYFRGRLSEEFYYKDDKLDGTYKKWDANSQLGVFENYLNGKRDGLCKYFNYGKCIREVTYEKDRINGEEKEYELTGQLFRISWYKKGLIDSCYTYHKNAKLATSRTYNYYPGFVYTEEFSEYKEWDEAGVLLLRGTYHFENKDKEWTTYYANGKVKSITPFSGGKIKGVYRKWYANEKKMLEMECDGQYTVSPPKVWDEKGKALKQGTKGYDEIVEGNKPGEIYNDPGKYKQNRTEEPTVRETDSGSLENEKLMDLVEQDQSIVPEMDVPPIAEAEDPVFTFAEIMPEFPGAPGAMTKFINDNLRYPLIEREQGIQGTVYIGCIIEKDGSVTHIKELKGVAGAPGMTKEAIRVVSIFPKFSPGKMNGMEVRCEYNVPVKFRLQ